LEGSAHRALDDAKMTAEVLRRVIAGLDLTNTQQYKDLFSNSKERRMVKNAIRMIRAQKAVPTWEQVAERLAAAKVDLSNAEKAAELQQYFQTQLEKRS